MQDVEFEPGSTEPQSDELPQSHCLFLRLHNPHIIEQYTVRFYYTHKCTHNFKIIATQFHHVPVDKT
jgi:hypothetical protein